MNLEIIALAISLLGGVAALFFSIIDALGAKRAESILVSNLKDDLEFQKLLQRILEVTHDTKLTPDVAEVVRKAVLDRLESLPAPTKRQLLSAVLQSSSIGQHNYIEKVVGEASGDIRSNQSAS
jgi:hypothetical protein